MLLRMQTIETTDLVTGAYEACASFSADGGGSPLCARCGWLDAEHEQEVAALHHLPARTVARQPKRLAS